MPDSVAMAGLKLTEQPSSCVLIANFSRVGLSPCWNPIEFPLRLFHFFSYFRKYIFVIIYSHFHIDRPHHISS